MYNQNQLVSMRWHPSNRKWFEQRGYSFTSFGDEFHVKAKDLMQSTKAKISVICDYCGEEFQAEYALMSKGREIVNKDCCHRCSGKKSSEISFDRRKKKYFTKLHSVCSELGYELLTNDTEYSSVKMYITYICPKHGVQRTILEALLNGHKCIECSYEERGERLRYSQDDVLRTINSTGGNMWINFGEYTGVFDHNLRIRCKCGNEYETSLANFVRHDVTKCFSCSQKESVGEKRIRMYLEANSIQFIPEYRFEDCRDTKSLPFDFYLPGKNICIEFDGRFHYDSIYGEEFLLNTQRHDRIKTDYCMGNGITLIRIPYWDGNKIEEILKNNICR